MVTATAGLNVTAGAAVTSASTLSPGPASGSSTGVRFELNQGQSEGSVRFVVRGAGYPMFLTGTDAVMVLTNAPVVQGNTAVPPAVPARGASPKAPTATGGHATRPSRGQTKATVTGAVLRLHTVGGSPTTRVVGVDQLPGVSNYVLGRDPTKWRTSVPAYAGVRYIGVYPGVDLVYHAAPGGVIEYDYEVAPGASTDAIAFDLLGADSADTNAGGDLAIGTAGGVFTQKRPQLYQQIAGSKHLVSGGYTARGANRFGFSVGAHDRSRPLVIDPELSYATYLGGDAGLDAVGGSGNDGNGITVDSVGDAYVTGRTFAPDFPTTTGAFQTSYFVNANNPYNPSQQIGTYSNAFVSKLTPDGSELVFSTYLGGSGGGNFGQGDTGRRIKLDPANDAYVLGLTDSADFPTTPSAYAGTQPVPGSFSAFLSKLSADGSRLIYSTYVDTSAGFSGIPKDLAVDRLGRAVIVGSASGGTPTTSNAFQTTCTACPLPTDGVVTVGSTTLTSSSANFSYIDVGSSVFGFMDDPNVGSNFHIAAVIDAHTATLDSAATFDATGTFGIIDRFGTLGWIGELDPSISGSAGLVYSSVINSDYGGAEFDNVAIDSTGELVIGGEAAGINLPTTPGAFRRACVRNCPFLHDGSTTQGSTTFTSASAGFDASQDVGGLLKTPDVPPGTTIASVVSATTVTLSAAATATGSGLDFYLKGPRWKHCCGNVVVKFDPTKSGASQLVYSTYLGDYGGRNGPFIGDLSTGIAVDAAGDAYVSGTTDSPNYPTTPGALSRTCGGLVAPCVEGSRVEDAFVTKVNATGTGLMYSTFLGGRSDDTSRGIGVDGGGHAVVVGSTSSTDFPVRDPVVSPSSGAFVSQLAADGSGLDWSTTIGGSSGYAFASDVAVTADGHAYVTGGTSSTDFPTTPGALKTTTLKAGAFVVMLSPVGTRPVVSRISPTTGPLGGNTAVTMTGHGFAGATSVTFGGNDSPGFHVDSDTQITALSPGQASYGTYPLVVRTPGGRSPANPIDRFTYIEGAWNGTGSQQVARFGASATLLRSGRVLVAAGQAGLSVTGECELYDPVTGTWTPTGSLNIARQSHTATLLSDGRVLVVGGTDSGTNFNVTSSAEIYDPGSGQWSVAASMAQARFSHTATLLPGGDVLVVGGMIFPGRPTSLATAEDYDPRTDTWTSVASLPSAAAIGNHTATLLPNGEILIAGGQNGNVAHDAAYLYDPLRRAFIQTGSMGSPRGVATATLLPDGRVLVAGGANGVLSPALNTEEIYDPATGTWSLTGLMLQGRAGHTATLLPNGKVLFTGGLTALGRGVALNSAELLDPVTNTETSAAQMAAVRGGSVLGGGLTVPAFTATLLSQGPCGLNCDKVLITGDSGDPSAELYTPAPSVTSVSPLSGPAAGGTVVTVNGTNFSNGNPPVVTFGGVPASAVQVNTVTQLTAISPSGAGVADVQVTTPGGTSTPTAADRFMYQVPPPSPAAGGGYWLVAADGGVFPYGGARGFGSTGGVRLNQPIVGMAPTPDSRGYWLVAADGGVFPFGDAVGYGSTGAVRLNRPVVGMAVTPDGKGYWLVASDGGIFPFGDASGFGSTGTIRLNKPIVGMAGTPDGGGYWLVASDGGIFPFGDAVGRGSTAAIRLNRPVVGMAGTPDGGGYWLVASDGGVFPFGDASGLGSTGGLTLNKPVVGMASSS